MLKEVPAAVDDVGHAAPRQFAGIQVHRGPGLHQDADVAQRNAARAAFSGADLPARIADQIGDQARYRGRFHLAQFIEPGLVQIRRRVHQRHPRLAGGVAVGMNRPVLRLRTRELRVGS